MIWPQKQPMRMSPPQMRKLITSQAQPKQRINSPSANTRRRFPGYQRKS